MTGGIGVIVLAAGASMRMGEANKLLADWQGQPLLRHVVETALNSDAGEVIVVTGHDADAIRLALGGLDVRFANNPHFEEGLSTSLITGVGAVGMEQAGAAFVLADMPMLKVETLNRLIAVFKEVEARSICVPFCGGRRGNPVIWPREFFPDIQGLVGDRGARVLMEKFNDRVREIPCEDTGVLMDFDTPDDFSIR